VWLVLIREPVHCPTAIPAGPAGMTEWERQKEQEEFSRAAKVFQHLVSSMSSRFTRSTDQDQGTEEKTKPDRPPERPLVSSVGILFLFYVFIN